MLDCEIVAYDQEKHKILPFQVNIPVCINQTLIFFLLSNSIKYYDHLLFLYFSGLQVLSTRARKGVVISDIKVSVCTYGFDILYLNGHPLLEEQLKVRREVT